MLCSWRLCSSPGMYAVTSLPLLSRTRAILRSAEFGFFGVIVLTCRHTPRFCGEACRSLTLLIRASARRGFLISWLIVGIDCFLNVDSGDFDANVALAVALLFVIALAALVLLDVDLVALLLAEDVGGDCGLAH